MKILSLIAVLFTISVASFVLFYHNLRFHCFIDSAEGSWSLEMARTPAEQSLGLMNRTQLCRRCGMMFLFSEEAQQSFWMKNTLIPLDMYFYDAHGKLVDLVHNMRPESETGTPMIYHARPAQYVIEVPHTSRFPANSVDILHCQ